MLKKIMCVAALSTCINSAHADFLDWSVKVKEDPMTDEKTVEMGSYFKSSEFIVHYKCSDNKDTRRYISFSPIIMMRNVIDYEFAKKSKVNARIRIDKGKIYDIEFKGDNSKGQILMFFSGSSIPEEAQKFIELERDLLQSTSRVVIELDGTAYVIPSGDAREAAKTVIDVCGALSPAS